MAFLKLFKKKKKLKALEESSKKYVEPTKQTPHPSPKLERTDFIIQKSTNPAFQEAWKQHWKDLDEDEKVAWSFEAHSTSLSPLQVHKTTEDMSKIHHEHSFTGRIASRVLSFLQVIDSLMAGATIGIQAYPEVGSIVLGVLRVVITAAIKYFEYYEKLTEMMEYLSNLLKTLDVFDGAKSNEPRLHEILVSIYTNVLCFCRQARRAYLGHGNDKKANAVAIFAKVQWASFEDQYRQIQVNLTNQTQNLNLVSTAIIMKSTLALDEDRKKKYLLEAKNERREFLDWICRTDSSEIHKIMTKNRYKDTGSWLLKKEPFINWINTENSILWLHGPAGTGKSVLSSVAINHLTKCSKSTGDTVIYTYFKGEDASMNDMPLQMISSLVKQLCWSMPHLPDWVIKFYHDFSMNARRPTFDDLEDLFHQCLSSFSHVFVVLDGLDECEEKQRRQVLKFVTGINARSKNAKVFVASRRELDILRMFNRHRVLSMSSQDASALQDIERFVEYRVETDLSHINPETQREAMKTLIENSKGMYLWVDLQVYELAHVPESDIRAQLKVLPPGLEGTYLSMFRRMIALPQTTRSLIQTCFLWALNSKELLSAPVFIDAVSLKHKMSSEQLNSYEGNEIREITFGLLNIGRWWISNVRPVHFSLQEFYIRPSQKHPPELEELLPNIETANAKMAIMCLQHLLLDTEPPEPFDTCLFFCGKWFDSYIRSLTEIPEELWNLLDRVLLQEPELMKRIMAWKFPSHHYDYPNFVCSGNPLSLDRTTFMRCTGLDKVPAIWIRYKEVETPKDYPKDYLYLAATFNVEDILHNIISQGTNINIATLDRWTPLHLAILSILDPINKPGIPITKILLDAGADWNFDARHVPSGHPREEYRTPLNEALFHKCYAAVKVIANHDSFNFATYMKTIPQKNGADYIKRLAEQGADINQRDENGDTALQIARQDGREDCVKALEELSALA